MPNSLRSRVVIVGAGFAGLQAAQRLANTAFDVVLLNRDNYHTFQPLLHQVATAELTPSQIACPLRKLLRRARNISFQMVEVTSVDPVAQIVMTQQGQHRYDFLVMATGSRVPLERFPGAKEFGFPLKTISQAVALRDQVIRSFEQATSLPTLPPGLLTFSVVGGGATGVELAGALKDWIERSLVKDYPTLSCQDIHVVLLQSGDRLLPGFSPKLQTYVRRHLQQLGIEVHLFSRVRQVSSQGITLTDDSFVASKTVVWTTGVSSDSPPLEMLRQVHPISNGESVCKISLLPTLQAADYPNIYFIGDIASVLQPNQSWPQLAAVAVQQGKAVARSLLRQSVGKVPLPFRYQHRGSMAILSRYAAVVQIGKLELTGFIAWIIWLGVHLALLRGHRSSTLLQWWNSQGRGERSAQMLLSPVATNPFF
ncbi:NAD(P)/FAD-dependent oxidoreductase [Leptolyngbya sp. BC1307]|uniref:NAD(P)/FAD-dependent oxidoreductase n=1 Tax=Leptolyngbya sp. BC1307 TaxID=2029589 RepID=UPI0014820182|nr:NAD(P)/FAD-dependent oxidoreductase [Leptolyngbya sp. BC1307]